MVALVYNEFWEYQGYNYLPCRPQYSVYSNDQIYFTSSIVLNKFNKNLITNIQSMATNNTYYGIYSNSSTGLLYLADSANKKIDIFNQNLSFVDSFNTTFSPWFITEYNGMLVITDTNSGKVYFYQNKVLIRNIITNCTNRVSSLLFDTYDQMMVLCNNPAYLYVYRTNGTLTGVGGQPCNSTAYHMNLDSKNRLVVICFVEIGIYY